MTTFGQLLANIPDGWLICDGNNGTPDLRDRFVRNVEDIFTNGGATGGTTQETIIISNMGVHNHDISDANTTHNHVVPFSASGVSGGQLIFKGGNDGLPKTPVNSELVNTADPIQFQGGDQPHTNMPTFFDVIFIQRVN